MSVVIAARYKHAVVLKCEWHPDSTAVIWIKPVNDRRGVTNGDLVVLHNGQELALSGPMQATASYDDGRITTTHVRQVSADQTFGRAIEIKPYDATYYTAYDITRGVRIESADGCTSRIEVPDIDAALRELSDVLASLDAAATPEDENLPDVGGLLALCSPEVIRQLRHGAAFEPHAQRSRVVQQWMAGNDQLAADAGGSRVSRVPTPGRHCLGASKACDTSQKSVSNRFVKFSGGLK